MTTLPKASKKAKGVIDDSMDSLLSLFLKRSNGLRFRPEHLFLDCKSEVFQWEDTGLRFADRLERLYLVIAITILFATLTGMAVKKISLRRHVDAHFRRGLSY